MNVSNVGKDLEMAVREESALMVTSVQEEEEVKGEKWEVETTEMTIHDGDYWGDWQRDSYGVTSQEESSIVSNLG